MPQVYHPPNRPASENRQRHSISSASSSSTSSASTGSMRPTDVDDSIVLSDLVRTGEASRLRRRGAMRIDHGTITTTSIHPYGVTRPPSPTMLVPDRQNWYSDFDTDSRTVLEGHLYRNPLSRFSSRIQPRSSRRHGPHDIAAHSQLHDQPDEYVYTLVCGTKIANFDSDEEVEPFKPSILPLYPPLSGSSNRSSMDRSTGCGAIVHLYAAPRSRVAMWTARSAAPSSVIALDASYFEPREATTFTRNACGCIKEGVGCAVCGNLLGIRYIPCKAASDSLFLPCNNRKPHTPDASTRLRGPEGPQYWQASPSSNHAIYTFFPHAVTSMPRYDFPPMRSSAHQRTYSNVSIDSSPPTVTQVFPSGPEGGFYANVQEANAVPAWDRLGEEHDRDMGELVVPRNHPDDEETITDAPRHEMILDRFSASSPLPLLETGDENISPTTTTVNRASWGFLPGAYLRHHTRSVASGHSVNNDNQLTMQYDRESFYQQQVQGAWEREQEVEGILRSWNEGRSADVGWGFDPDGESEVWGVTDVEQSRAPADPYDSESADKSTEGPFFPER